MSKKPPKRKPRRVAVWGVWFTEAKYWESKDDSTPVLFSSREIAQARCDWLCYMCRPRRIGWIEVER